MNEKEITCYECGIVLTSDNNNGTSEELCDTCWDRAWDSQFWIDEDGRVHTYD